MDRDRRRGLGPVQRRRLSKFWRISLGIRIAPSEVCLEVADDGSGFTVEAEGNGQNRRFGIVGMKERVEKLEGVLSIASAPGAATNVAARIPLTRVNPALARLNSDRPASR